MSQRGKFKAWCPDKILYRGDIIPVKFCVIGTEEVYELKIKNRGKSFSVNTASDHYGLYCEYQINNKK